MGKSIALINDAFHSLSDLLATSVALLGFRVSLRPRDVSHHYGHYKAEPLVGLFVALTLVAIGVITGYRAILSIIKGPVAPRSIAAVAALISILGMHEMRVRQLGRGVSVDLHIKVDSKSSVIEGDEIANAVRERLEDLEEVDSALVHICPHNK